VQRGELDAGVDFASLLVLTDGFENRPRFLSEVSSLITDRVFAICLGAPDQIQPVALQTLTNGTNGYLLMTAMLNTDDPFRLASGGCHCSDAGARGGTRAAASAFRKDI
jgi:hypothetical protein